MNTLGEVLSRSGSLRWNASLYVQAESPLCVNTPCQVVKADEFTLDPLEPVEPGLVRIASIDDVTEVLMNARAQVANPTAAQLVEGLRYFLARDAFITFKKK